MFKFIILLLIVSLSSCIQLTDSDLATWTQVTTAIGAPLEWYLHDFNLANTNSTVKIEDSMLIKFMASNIREQFSNETNNTSHNINFWKNKSKFLKK